MLAAIDLNTIIADVLSLLEHQFQLQQRHAFAAS